MPPVRQEGRAGSFISALVHFAILMAIFIPASYGRLVTPVEQGAGGPGPAGGGGGRSAPSVEYINFVKALPPPPSVRPPVFQFRPPDLPKLPTPQLQQFSMPAITAPSLGLTTDGRGGAGPGSGRGVGSGVGTGRGSANGPGTGGGNQENYPPRSDQLFLPPFPVPAAIKGDTIIAEFDVDERGRVVGFQFTETSDRAYNRRLREAFREYKWKPGTRPDGTPIRMKGQVQIVLP